MKYDGCKKPSCFKYCSIHIQDYSHNKQGSVISLLYFIISSFNLQIFTFCNFDSCANSYLLFFYTFLISIVFFFVFFLLFINAVCITYLSSFVVSITELQKIVLFSVNKYFLELHPSAQLQCNVFQLAKFSYENERPLNNVM